MDMFWKNGIVVIVFLLAGNCFGVTYTVDDNDPCADFAYIQDAIDVSSNGDVIEVQPGTYYERINFYGKEITVTGTDPCNINTVYATGIDAGITGDAVTFDSGETNESRLVGMTIQSNNNYGISCYYSDPLISRCVIQYNNTGIYGSYAEPTIAHSIIRENNNGIYDCDGKITECEIRENNFNGLTNCEGYITGCVISKNDGNGLQGDQDEYANIRNCIISGNKSSGLHSVDRSTIVNCTIVGNNHYGLYDCRESVVTNCIIANNAQYGVAGGVNITLRYNNIWGNISGNYNGVAPGDTDTHENPRFAVDGYWDSENEWIEGAYYLKSVAGRWDSDIHAWVNDDVTSLCVDAGDPTGGALDESVPNGGRINQGAYGGTEYASKSPWGFEPFCGEYIDGDANLDCRIDLRDIAIIASHWLECNLVPAEACGI